MMKVIIIGGLKKLTNAVHTFRYFSGITHEEIAIQGERKTPQQQRLRNSSLWIN